MFCCFLRAVLLRNMSLCLIAICVQNLKIFHNGAIDLICCQIITCIVRFVAFLCVIVVVCALQFNFLCFEVYLKCGRVLLLNV